MHEGPTFITKGTGYADQLMLTLSGPVACGTIVLIACICAYFYDRSILIVYVVMNAYQLI